MMKMAILYNEGHRFFLVKMHLKYSGKTTSKIQFDSPIICKYPDGTYYSLGGIDYIDKALLENSTCHFNIKSQMMNLIHEFLYASLSI